MKDICIISGFPKCRTTYYYQKLIYNPSFKTKEQKEIRCDFTKNNYDKYHSILIKNSRGKFLVDSSPEYVYSDSFKKFINENQNILNFVLIRDPIKRLESVLNFKKSTIGNLNFKNLDEVVLDFILNKEKSKYSVYFERTRYENFTSGFKQNTIFIKEDDEDLFFDIVNKNFKENFNYKDVVIINTNPTAYVPFPFRFILKHFKKIIPRILKDQFNFLKIKVVKQKFGSESLIFLKDYFKETYHWIEYNL